MIRAWSDWLDRKSSRENNPATGQSGFTLVEIIVALTILSIGSAVLWYSLRSSARLDKMNRLHHAANDMARSELESLRSLHRNEIRDTTYAMKGPGGEDLVVVRDIFDSSDIASLPEMTLDDRMSPKELQQPVEVRVRVFMSTEKTGTGFGMSLLDLDRDRDWGSGSSGSSGESTEMEGQRVLATLLLRIPDYRWF